jgi:hypothetical protein
MQVRDLIEELQRYPLTAKVRWDYAGKPPDIYDSGRVITHEEGVVDSVKSEAGEPVIQAI